MTFTEQYTNVDLKFIQCDFLSDYECIRSSQSVGVLLVDPLRCRDRGPRVRLPVPLCYYIIDPTRCPTSRPWIYCRSVGCGSGGFLCLGLFVRDFMKFCFLRYS